MVIGPTEMKVPTRRILNGTRFRPSRVVQGLVLVLLISKCLNAQASGPNVEAAIQSALRQRDFHQGLQLAQEALRQFPRNAQLWTMEGIALSGLGRDKEALGAYNHALQISPDYLAALEGAAELEYKSGNGRAAPLLNHILKIRPDDPTSHAMLGVLAYKQKDCGSAVKHFHASQSMLKSQPVALSEYGSCLMDVQQAEQAIAVFQQIHELSPDDPH